MDKILYLPLKKEWYEMIENGVKTEEYRELKEFWWKRISTLDRNAPQNQDIDWGKWEYGDYVCECCGDTVDEATLIL